jgi:hypothetical protein
MIAFGIDTQGPGIVSFFHFHDDPGIKTLQSYILAKLGRAFDTFYHHLGSWSSLGKRHTTFDSRLLSTLPVREPALRFFQAWCAVIARFRPFFMPSGLVNGAHFYEFYEPGQLFDYFGIEMMLDSTGVVFGYSLFDLEDPNQKTFENLVFPDNLLGFRYADIGQSDELMRVIAYESSRCENLERSTYRGHLYVEPFGDIPNARNPTLMLKVVDSLEIILHSRREI